jgi:hypothetical protein
MYELIFELIFIVPTYCHKRTSNFKLNLASILTRPRSEKLGSSLVKIVMTMIIMETGTDVTDCKQSRHSGSKSICFDPQLSGQSSGILRLCRIRLAFLLA